MKSTIASGGYMVLEKKNRFYLQLSRAYRERERQRRFAATAAAELQSLSQRVAHIVPHQGEVGRYREDLLRAVLERSVPKRYHVATGFVYGCDRQLDILIYDQIDYAPMFREAGVVVVRPEAVRAVIEVKSTLNVVEIEDALGKLAEVSACDDCNPPFFKGVFAYRGPVNEDTTTNYIVEHYNRDSFEDGDAEAIQPALDSDAQSAAEGSESAAAESTGDRSDSNGDYVFNRISEPFKHVTAVCVDKSYFAEVRLELAQLANGTWFRSPTVAVVGSKTDLAPHTALFVELLCQHLRVPTVKPDDSKTFENILAANLAGSPKQPIYNDLWGLYLGADINECNEYLERFQAHVDAWRSGSEWLGKPDEPALQWSST